MVQPINYMLDLPDPTDNILKAMQVTQGMNQMRAQQAQAQAQAQAQQQFQQGLQALGPNPSPAAYASLMAKNPAMSEIMKEPYEALSAEQKKASMGQASKVYAAINSGSPQVAQGLLDEYAQAYRNSGNETEAKSLETLSKLVELSPERASNTIALYMASIDPEKASENYAKLQQNQRDQDLQPATLTEAQAKAEKAAVAAKFAESNAVMDLEKKGWDIKAIQNDMDIKRMNTQIASINASTSRLNANTRLQELKANLGIEEQKLSLKEREMLQKDREMQLKLKEKMDKRDQLVQDKAAEVESARGNIDNMLNTMDRIIQTPDNVVEDATGPISARMPTLDKDTADFEALIENIDAQAFLAQIPNLKGMGALSDSEGKKVAAALQNFSLKQSPKQLIGNMREAQRLMLKARENIARRYGVPDSVPDTPAVETGASDIEALIQKYGG